MNEQDKSWVLDELSGLISPDNDCRPPSREDVRDLCSQMAVAGYIPTNGSIQAAELYLSGHNLHLRGKVGTGKSAFFKALSETRAKNGARRGFAVIPMANLDGIHMPEIREFLSVHENDELVIDDLGSESMTNDYGKPVWAIGMILSMREYTSARTHVTSNVRDQGLKEQYGERIFSRLRRFMSVEFIDSDFRSPTAQTIVKTPGLYYQVLGKVGMGSVRTDSAEIIAMERDMTASRPWD